MPILCGREARVPRKIPLTSIIASDFGKIRKDNIVYQTGNEGESRQGLQHKSHKIYPDNLWQ